MKYQIWNGLYKEVFDNKTFDTYDEAEKYYYENSQRINEICDTYYGHPVSPKDYFFIDPVE